MGSRRQIGVLSTMTLVGILLYVIMGNRGVTELAVLGYILTFFSALGLIPLIIRYKLNEPWSKE